MWQSRWPEQSGYFIFSRPYIPLVLVTIQMAFRHPRKDHFMDENRCVYSCNIFMHHGLNGLTFGKCLDYEHINEIATHYNKSIANSR